MMENVIKWGRLIVLAGLLTVGCSEEKPLPPQELTFEELNAALAYLKEQGKRPPGSVYDLTNLPQLQGKVFPELPDGQYLTIDPERNQVTIEFDRLPDYQDSFPR